MKRLIYILMVCALFSVALADDDNFTLRQSVYQPRNTITVEEGGSISGAVARAVSGDVIFLNPGTYNEQIGTVNKQITFKSTSERNVIWEADSMICTLGVDSIKFESMYLKANLDGQLMDVNGKDYFLTNCILECSTFTVAEAGTFLYTKGVEFLCRKSGGLIQQGGTIYADEYFHVGTPVSVSDPNLYKGWTQAGGLLHLSDKGNFYSADTVSAVIDMFAGNIALQEGALIGAKGGNDKSIAVRLRNDATFYCNGGDIQNNSSDSATVRIWAEGSADSAAVEIINTRIINSGGGLAYFSESAGLSTLTLPDFTGEITAGNLNIHYIDGEGRTIFLPSPDTIPDSTYLLVNNSAYDRTITKIVGVCNADNFDFRLGQMSLTGGDTPSVIDILDLNINGQGGFFKQVVKSDLDDSLWPKLAGIWYTVDGAETPDWLIIYIEWRVNN